MPYTTKQYARINWKNRPSTSTALGATNLNRMDVFLNEVDNTLIEFEAKKLNIATANSMIASLAINVDSGIITATQLDGTVFTWDLNLEKIPVSFSLSEDGILTMTTEDGTIFDANISDLIKDYIFKDSDTIAFSKEFKKNETDTKGSYHVTAIIRSGSIKQEHLNPDYRADIQNYMNIAQTAANESLQYSKDSKRYSEGDPEYLGSATDNSKYYKEQAEAARDQAEIYRDEANTQARTNIMAPGRVGVGMPDNITIKAEEDGTIYAMTATNEKKGMVKPDEKTIFAKEDGEISAKTNFYESYKNFPEVGDPNLLYIDDTVDPRLAYTWDPETQKYILTGGAGGADGSSIDIPIILTVIDWEGTTAPYTQTITVPQMREGMTPLFYLSSTGAEAEYAYSLITGYTASYAEITFYAADLPDVDLSLTLKGIPAQELDYVDNTIVVIAEPSAFAVSTDPAYDGRYVATIPVDGMQAGTGGAWDIVRSGPVLTEAESKIALSITDVERLDGAVRIVALEAPEQRFLMSIQGTYAGAGEGDIILAGMQEWFDRVEALEEEQKNNILKYVDGENIAEVTITENNYAQLPSAPSGISPVFITAAYFGSCTGCFNIMSIGDGRCYAVGDAGTSITSLTIRYWYREKGY